MTVTQDLLAYYEQDREHARLREGRGRLEFWRTQDVLRRTLEDPECRALMLGAQRSMESVPSLLGVSGHMLTVSRRER
ncbi:hypothetical protein [Nonomuraea sp. B19D2]|uniref:hypothetical protein n=1 Tax=Nonomuraea sp. B19D2 TaxID=3159561 RepID=UPI0032DB9E0B